MLSLMMKRTARLARCEGGNVIMIVGLMAFLLIMAVGVAVDMARAQILQQRISAALDAAGLAAASDISNPQNGLSNKEWANQEAARYFFANIPQGYLGSTIAAPVVTLPNNDLNTLYLTDQATQPTVFMQAAGYTSLNVGAQSTVTRSNNGQGLEIALVLDNTGSMNQPVNVSNSGVSKLSALETAITGTGGLLDILYGNSDVIANQYIGVVPFSQAVNVGTGNNTTSWLNPAATSFNWGPGGSWGGCVEARDLTEDPPSAGKFAPYYFQANTPVYTDNAYVSEYHNVSSHPTADSNGYVNFNPWGPVGIPAGSTPYYINYNTSTGNYDQVNVAAYESNLSPSNANGYPAGPQGPSRFCPQAITQMVASKASVASAIGTLVATGDTNLDQGMVWGWRLLSPSWRGSWQGGDMAANNLPLDYNTPDAEKIVILMTDGMNHYGNGNYTAYGFLSQGKLGSNQEAASEAALDANTEAVCTSMKTNQHITIYTIGFGTTDDDDSSNPTSVNGPLLKNCATDINHYFLAPTNAQLAQVFTQIANSIENIRISK